MKRFKLLGISGSIREQSYNSAILQTLSKAVADIADMDIFPLNDVPLYNQDTDLDPALPAVAALRTAIRDADGLVIASPEYNFGVSGVLKNALDWASRPYGASPLVGKPVLTLTSSPAFTGGARAQAQLTETLIGCAARIVLRPQAVVASVHEKVRDGELVDETTLNFLKVGVMDLIKDIPVTGTVTIQET